MAEYTLKYINHRARYDAPAFIRLCEQQYHSQIEMVAEEIAQNSAQKPIVLLNGPSSSGKTTTSDRVTGRNRRPPYRSGRTHGGTGCRP